MIRPAARAMSAIGKLADHVHRLFVYCVGVIPPQILETFTETLLPHAGKATDPFPAFMNADFSVSGTAVGAFTATFNESGGSA